LRHVNRRNFLTLAMAMLAAPAMAQTAEDTGKAMLEAASPLGDRVLGKADAPVTLIEYASATALIARSSMWTCCRRSRRNTSTAAR
jgi:hypothetical protein